MTLTEKSAEKLYAAQVSRNRSILGVKACGVKLKMKASEIDQKSLTSSTEKLNLNRVG